MTENAKKRTITSKSATLPKLLKSFELVALLHMARSTPGRLLFRIFTQVPDTWVHSQNMIVSSILLEQLKVMCLQIRLAWSLRCTCFEGAPPFQFLQASFHECRDEYSQVGAQVEGLRDLGRRRIHFCFAGLGALFVGYKGSRQTGYDRSPVCPHSQVRNQGTNNVFRLLLPDAAAI